MASAAASREHGLDALRVFAFALLILYHAGMGYVPWGWHVKNPETSTALAYVMVFFSQWRLPLLFFISGAAVAFALRRRTLAQLAGDRVVRLLVPLVFGVLVVVPPQIYFERLTQGVRYESYLAFYRTVFDFVPYPEGGALSWHHLWYVAYVLVFSLASLPLFALVRRAAGERALQALAGALERWPLALYLIPLPAIAAGIVLDPRWPTTHDLVSDWANLTRSWLMFLWGFVFASERRLLDIVTRRWRELLAVGVAVAVASYVVRARGGAHPAVRTTLSAYFALTWVFALVGLARARIAASTPLLRYATEAVYSFYIVHQTITVALVYVLAPVPLGIAPKLALTAAGTFLGSWLVYEAIRRVPPLRPLFGLKLAREPAAGA
ncbi:MAG TPA: acyltransferase family protein [Kofleriaceae bacterium]|nr:acyltransferase family protein [Kofleriaceae bacterium]